MKTYNLIVAGGRDFDNYQLLSEQLIELSETHLRDRLVNLVSGMAKGADLLAFQFAKEHGVNCIKFPANWNAHGKSAGYIRNSQMASVSDGLLAFWDGQSKGTKNMIDTMNKLGKFVHVVQY